MRYQLQVMSLVMAASLAAGVVAWAEDEKPGAALLESKSSEESEKAVAPADGSAMVGVHPNLSLTVNAYVGKVNGEPVFVENVIRPVDGDLKRLAKLTRNLSEFRSEVRTVVTNQLRNTITDILNYQAAKDSLTEDDQKMIDVYMNTQTKNLLSQYEGSAAKADQALRAVGSSFDKELTRKKHDYIGQIYVYRKIRPQIVITRKMMLEAYQRDIKKYTIQQEIDLYRITLPVMKYLPKEEGKPISNPTAEQLKDARAAATNQAKRIIAELKTGAEFADLAATYSADSRAKDGGRWPHIQKGMLASKELEDAAFALGPNSIGEPIQIVDETNPRNNAVIIIKVGNVTPAKVIGFDAAQTDLESRLWKEQSFQLSQEFTAKLWAKAAIDNQFDRMVDSLTDVVTARYLSR